MEKRYIAALDQGTTSSRCILFDREQNIVSVAQKEFTQFYPRPGWVEHDPMEIWSSQYGVLMEALAQSGVDIRELAYTAKLEKAQRRQSPHRHSPVTPGFGAADEQAVLRPPDNLPNNIPVYR